MRTLTLLCLAVLAVVLSAAAAENALSLDAAVSAMKTHTLGDDFAACQRIMDEITAAGTDAGRPHSGRGEAASRCE